MSAEDLNPHEYQYTIYFSDSFYQMSFLKWLPLFKAAEKELILWPSLDRMMES